MKYSNKEKFTLRQVVIMLAIVFLGIAIVSYGAVTIPNSFTSGETISSSEVNANFTAVANQMPAVKSAYYGSQLLGAQDYDDILSLQITAPSSGYVFLTANGYLSMITRNDVTHDCYVGISDTSDGTPEYGHYVRFSFSGLSDANNHDLNVPYGANAVLPVTAGTHTYYIVGGNWGTLNVTATQNRLTAMFVPNALP